MNPLAEILFPEHIRLGCAAHDRCQLFRAAGQLFAAHLGQATASQVTESLSAREELGSTALGLGVALPHARIKGLRRPLAAYLRLQSPIPFDAPDDRPVADYFILLVPEQATQAHLELLALVAEKFGDPAFRDRLHGQVDVSGVYQAFFD